ncbi:MAG TPA: lectin like domain-containing protein, partial [Geobacteraceae bacterium]
ITGAGLYNPATNSTYDWYVYTGVTTGNPRSGTLAASGTGQPLATPGYQVVPLTPVAVTAGQKFSVVITLTTPGYDYPIPLEYPIGGYASQATASAGQSYYSYSGSAWTDVTSSYPNTNVALKALSQYAVSASVSGGNGTLSSPATSYTGTGGSAVFTLAPDTGYRPASSVSGSCATGSFADNTYTTGAVSGNCTVGFSFVSSDTYALNLAVSGVSGSISATPTPPGGTCPGTCIQNFASGTVVTLTPTPETGALFSNWSGDCSGSGACQVPMNGMKSVTAFFTWGPNVKNAGSGTTFGRIGDAYAAASDGETIRLRDLTFSEALNCNRAVTVTLRGGYDSSFTTRGGATTISGSLTVTGGTVEIDGITIA